MHVQSEDEKRAGELLELFDDAVVTAAGREHLILPVREGMSASGGDGETHAFRRIGQLAPDPEDLVGQLGDVAADLGPDLDDRLVELALDLIAQRRSARREKLRDV